MNEIEEIKRRIDIVDLISGYLTLKKAGTNYRALCPFHHEKTPSMMISPEKQIFKCFGCQAGGDIFEFVQKMENLEFVEALNLLADRSGVKLEKRKFEPGEKPDQKSRLFAVNRLASQIYQKILHDHPAGKPALEYLKNRKINLETIKTFGLGYAPKSPVVKKMLKQKGFTDEEIYHAGGQDRFFERIVFPIRDVMGNTIGFTGRATYPDQQPKYLNTPETPIFHKGRILYNLDLARGEIKLNNATIIVEGQMDVISSYQAGVKNVVATSGTALTEDHLKILYRYTPNIIFAFDSDAAGLATAKKAYEMALVEGMNVKMVDLQSGLNKFKDPGEVTEKEPKLWREMVETAPSVIDWYFKIIFAKFPVDKDLTAIEKKEIAKEILPIIKKIPDNIEQAHYVEKLARKLQIPDDSIFLALEKTVNQTKNTKEKETILPQKEKLTSAELLLGLLINNPKLLEKISELSEQDLTPEAIFLLYKSLFNWYNKYKKNESKEFFKFIKEKHTAFQIQKAELLSLEADSVFTKSAIDNNQNLEKIAQDLVAKIKSQKNENLKKHYAEAIAQAEAEGDREKLKQLIKEFQNAISR